MITGAPVALVLCISVVVIATWLFLRSRYHGIIQMHEGRHRLNEDRHKAKDEFIEQLKQRPPTTDAQLSERISALESKLENEKAIRMRIGGRTFLE